MPNDLGRPLLPGSKSHAQRALLLAALAPGTWTLHNAPQNADVLTLRRALEGCGAAIRAEGGDLVVAGRAPVPGATFRLDVGENATAARTLLLVLPLLGCAVHLDGKAGLRRRPMGAAIQALRALGIPCSGEALPLHADGRALHPAPGMAVEVDAAVTTQAATGAMLATALRGGGTVHVHGAVADGYVQLTVQVLQQFGVPVHARRTGARQTFAIGAAPGGGGSIRVPPDPSARAFVCALAALHGLPLPAALQPPPGDAHPDWQIDADLRDLRAKQGDLVLRGLAQRPDCVPALAVVAAVRSGRTAMPGLSVLRGKESDRLQAMADGLRAMGVCADVVDDDLVVVGPLQPPSGRARVPAAADHRIVMALALLGTVLPGGVELDHAEAAAKSWPGFFDWLGRCAAIAGSTPAG